MTTKSDGALPAPGDQQTESTLATTAQAVQQQQVEEEEVDIDEQDVANARAAAEAEEAAAGNGDGQQVEPGPQGQQQAQPTGQGQAQPGQQSERIMIPKERFDEALTQRQKAETEAAYWRGVAEARGHGQQPTGQSQAPAQPQTGQATPEQRLAAIHSQQDALAARFDNGEITYAELVRDQRKLGNDEQAIREEMLLAKVKPADPQQQAKADNDELYLQTLTAQLEDEHPWVKVFDQVGTEIDWKYLKDRAVENLVARGVDPTQGNLGRYELRKEVAQLADEIGPFLVGNKARAKGIAIPGQTQQQQQQQRAPTAPGQRQLTPIQQARAAKLAQAENQAPDLNRMNGTTGNSVGAFSDAQIEGMSEEVFDNLPDAQRRQLLGLT